MTAPRFQPSDDIIQKMSESDRKALKLSTRDEINTKLEAKAEKQIQSEVESWLRLNGYWPRSTAFLDGKKPPKGFYVHIHSAKRNPIILDLLVVSLGGRCLELELKTATGRVRPEQKVILNTIPCARLARSTGQAIDIIKEWEQ